MWFKRDLRVHDHAPLLAALAHTDALGLFVIEPEWLQSPECDSSHVDFALACLQNYVLALALRGLPLLVRVGSAVTALAQLHNELAFTHLLSHEETGRAGRMYAMCRWQPGASLLTSRGKNSPRPVWSAAAQPERLGRALAGAHGCAFAPAERRIHCGNNPGSA